MSRGRRWRPDITIIELQLLIEYGGVYYHRGKDDQDARKSAALRSAGWTVIRMREHPLPLLHPDDMLIPILNPAGADELVSDLLTHTRLLLEGDALRAFDAARSHARTSGTSQWRWQAPPPRFLRGLESLTAFLAREGHARPLSEHEESGFPLGRWVMTQRRLHRAGRLPVAQLDLLGSMPGWAWDWREDRWEQFLIALRTFAAREGHLRVPQEHREGSYRLGQKVAATRIHYKSGRLPAERAQQLDQLPGWASSVGNGPSPVTLAAVSTPISAHGVAAPISDYSSRPAPTAASHSLPLGLKPQENVIRPGQAQGNAAPGLRDLGEL